jgi:hypothetical protein
METRGPDHYSLVPFRIRFLLFTIDRRSVQAYLAERLGDDESMQSGANRAIAQTT